MAHLSCAKSFIPLLGEDRPLRSLLFFGLNTRFMQSLVPHYPIYMQVSKHENWRDDLEVD